uniref:eukaryotic translation initiation factor 4E-binding protein 1 isoform X3 n=1 Tax=Lonchura striata TaxID=40157 RepID=UPI001293A6F7|nr:eukaryotic translation initiation factor 4E-binding protein 1 isoform X3 [Lonchura striata domestica]
MSGRCCHGQTPSRDIPGPGKCLALPDEAPLPPGDYSTTPGGTVFGTTPGVIPGTFFFISNRKPLRFLEARGSAAAARRGLLPSPSAAAPEPPGEEPPVGI